MNQTLRISIAFLLCTLLFASALLACKVPVFRYALERWPADSYRVVAIVDQDSAAESSAALKALDSSSRVWNAETEVVQLDSLSEDQLWQLEGIENMEGVPLLQVFYPEKNGQRKLCWSGPLTVSNVQGWLASPLRTEIAERIHAGTSAVWLLVEGRDIEENQQLFEQLQFSLKQASEQIKVPEGVIARKDATVVLKDDPSASMDDVLRSDIPLKIEFEIIRLAEDDLAEFALRKMISEWNPSLRPPFVVPIFGRGRMMEPLNASAFRDQAVTAACRYLVGECSCSVKALNPGIDLLLDVDWQQAVGEDVLIVDRASVPGQTVAIPPGSGRRKAVSDSTESMPSNAIETGRSNSSSRRALLVGAITIVMFGTFVFLARRLIR